MKIDKPLRILLSNVAHLGDLVNATAVLPVLKSAFPQAKIGFLVGESSKKLLEEHTMVDWIHVIDHWKFSRKPVSLKKKILHYWRARKEVVQEIAKNKYDVSIDLYYYLGNTIPLVKKAKIKTRIGFTSGGFGPLLTHPVDWENIDQPVFSFYKKLLQFFPIEDEHIQKLKPTLAPISEDLQNRFSKRFPQLNTPYILLHPGSGADFKQWPIAEWKKLLQQLVKSGYTVVLSGYGEKEVKDADFLSKAIPEVINCCNQFSLNEFVIAIQRASLLLGVDSVAGHIAAAVNTKAILIYAGINNTQEWAPFSSIIQVIQKKVACSPCYQRRGCKSMECIRGISKDQIFLNVQEALKNRC